jgi:probable rRNA maturation factor
MSVIVDIDNAVPDEWVPAQQLFEAWITLALQTHTPAEVSIRIVSKEESAALNQTYRGKSNATNVLSFPADIPKVVESNLLGDLVICAGVLSDEATAQQKPLQAHWAHITIHGVLHLLGYDHIRDEDANTMEQLEINLLKQLGYDNPYL